MSSASEQRAVEIDEAIREIERELAGQIIRLSAVERVAIAHILERFAERWPHQREFRPW